MEQELPGSVHGGQKDNKIMNREEIIYEKLMANKMKYKDGWISLKGCRYNTNSFQEVLAKDYVLDANEAKKISAYIFDKLQPTTIDTNDNDNFNLDDWIRHYLSINNVKCNFNGTWDINDMPLKQEIFISQMFLDLDRIKQAPSIHMATNSLNVWEEEQIEEFESVMMNVIAYDPSAIENGNKELCRYVDAISDDDDERNKIHFKVIQHIIWQIKRKMLNLPIHNHLMLNLYGETRAGKSVAVRELLSIVWELTYENGTMKMFSDSRELFLLQKFYVVLLEELEGADRTDVSALKRVMTSDLVSYRILGMNKNSTAKNKATFLATANTRIKDTIYDPTSAGRYWEVNCKPKVKFKESWPTIKDIKYIDIWRSVNENAESPVMGIVDTIQKIQEKEFKAQTHFEIWLDEQMITPISDTDEDAQEVDLDLILQAYNSNCTEITGFKKISKPIIGRDLVRLGFAQERKSTKDGKKTYYYLKDDKQFRSFEYKRELDEATPELIDIHKIYGVKDNE